MTRVLDATARLARRARARERWIQRLTRQFEAFIRSRPDEYEEVAPGRFRCRQGMLHFPPPEERPAKVPTPIRREDARR